MRLFTLAIVIAIGILIGVAIYAGQALIHPATPASSVEMEMNGAGQIVEAGSGRARASFDSSNYNSVGEYRSQLPEAFQFPMTSAAAIVAVPSLPVSTQAPVALAPLTARPDQAQVRSDAPVLMPPPSVPQGGTAHAHTSGSGNHLNVQFTLSGGDGVGPARKKTIVNK